MVSARGRDEDVSMLPEGEPDLEKVAQQIQNLFKLKIFYDQIDFNIEQRLTNIKVIIELTDPSGSSNLFQSRWRRNSRFEDITVVLY